MRRTKRRDLAISPYLSLTCFSESTEKADFESWVNELSQSLRTEDLC